MAEVFLRLKTPAETQPLEFATFADFAAWLESWRKDWEWLWAGDRLGWTSAAQSYTQTINAINNWKNQSNLQANIRNESMLSNFARQVTQLLEQWNLEPPPFLCPTDPRSRFVIELKNSRGPEAALFAVTLLVKGTLTPKAISAVPVEALEGFFDSYLLKAGYKDPSPYEVADHDSFLKGQAQKFDETRASFKATHDEAQAQVDSTKAEIDRLKAEGAETKIAAESQIETISKALKRTELELAELKKTMKEGLALRAPVEYWKKNSLDHNELANKYGRWVGFGSGFILLYILAPAILLLYILRGVKPELWELGIFAASTGLLLYLLRIVVRVQLSHLHLSTDAAQRAVMVQTYLSLEHDKEVITKEDRHLVLEALFRPVGAGLVKDDQASLNILEFLLNSKRP